LHSTPQTDHVTPAKQPSASSIEQVCMLLVFCNCSS